MKNFISKHEMITFFLIILLMNSLANRQNLLDYLKNLEQTNFALKNKLKQYEGSNEQSNKESPVRMQASGKMMRRGQVN